jgi:PiT family inorganic phosphate transporter
VVTRVLRPRLAVLWAAFFNFIAFAFLGTKVANTVGQTVKPEAVSVAVIFAALLGAILWNYITWWLLLPTSSSHALVEVEDPAATVSAIQEAINGGATEAGS